VSVVALDDQARGPTARAEASVAHPLLAVAALTLLAAVLRFARISHQGFWFDEANTAQLVHLSLGKMIGLVPQTQLEPPWYFAAAWVWARIFGFGEAGLRSLSAVAGVLTVPVMYATGAKLISRRAGLIVAALTATSPILIWYSQEARSYELLVLLSAVTLLTFLYVLEAPTGRSLTAWVLACVLALAMHYYAVLLVVPEAAWLLYVHRRRRSLYVAIAAIGLVGIALLAEALTQLGIKNADWIKTIPLGLRLSQLTPQFLLGFGAPGGYLMRTLDLLVVLGAVALLWRRGGRAERRGAALAGGLAFAGAVMMLALVAVGVDNLITRNVIVLWLPLALVVAAGLAAPRARMLGLAGVLVLCATGIAATIGVAVNRNLQRPDWRPLAAALGAPPAGGGARAIVIQHYRTLLPLSVYLPRLRFFRHGARIEELDVISIRTPQHPACWWGAACNLVQSHAPASLPVAGFHIVGEQRLPPFTLLRLRSDRPVYVTRQMVAHALTTTVLGHDGFILQPRAATR
jgi:4-amino-4-deoxy-L-arabinose transferase-like glycosyltransferase